MKLHDLKQSCLVFRLASTILFLIKIDALRFKINITVTETLFMYKSSTLGSGFYNWSFDTSYDECFNKCKMNTRCLSTVSVGGIFCYLYDKNQTLTKNVNSIATSKQPLEWTKPYFHKYWCIRLTNHFKFEAQVENENDCYNLCIREYECHAISYDIINNNCYFYQKDNYQSSDDVWFISISGKEKLNLNKHIEVEKNASKSTGKSWFTYKNVRLLGHYRVKLVDSIESCFNECQQSIETCFAALINQSNNICYFYKRDEFSVIKAENYWLVMSKERLIEEPNIFRYQGLRLYNHYSYSSALNEQCFEDCVSQPECFAVAYRPNANMGCLFYKNDEYRTKNVDLNDKKWEIISKEFIKIEERKYETTTKATIETQKNDSQVTLRPFNYPGISLKHEYFSYTNISSSQHCFQICKLDGRCFAIGFHAQHNLCHLYEMGELHVKKSNDWIVFSKYVFELGQNTFDRY